MIKKEKIQKIFNILKKRYSVRNKKINPFRVLMHVMLASRTTDLVSWPAADRLIEKGKNISNISKMKINQIEKIIYPSNYYKTKAKNIKKTCKMIIEEFDSKIPKTRENLMKLPGVGGKSADIVLSFSYNKPVIAVDAHVKWIVNTLKISNEKEPEKIRKELHEIFPKNKRIEVNDLFVQFGKEICNTSRPKCWMCPIKNICPYDKKRLKK